MNDFPHQLEVPEVPSGEARPPQFSLRSLLIVISLVSGLFALLSVLPPLWSFAAIWVGLLVMAHVSANAWGKRTFEPGALRPGDTPPRLPTPLAGSTVKAAEPQSILLRRQATLERSRYVATVVSAAIGGLIGCVVLALIHLPQASIAACAVWTCASAIISGIAGFVGSGFWQVVTRSSDELAPLP